MNGLYLHIPFCRRKCFYCHFVKGTYDDELAETYIEALTEEIRLRDKPGEPVDTLYIGGGSPSLLSEKQVTTAADAIYKYFNIHTSTEFTIEVNPEDVTKKKLDTYRDVGINRLSIGTQSFCPADLRYLKRTHGVEQSLAAVEAALERGFSNINLDFIISLPTQDKKTLAENFSILREFDIPHISAYILEDVEEGEEKNVRDNELYFFSVEHLTGLGYVHYEVSNFCKPGLYSRHNRKYWENESYIGIGLSASGYENGMDYGNARSFKGYFGKLEAGLLPRVEVTRRDANLRGIVMGLRLLEGIPGRCFEKYPEPLEFLLSNGILIRKKDNIAINPEKILLLNEVLTYLI